MVDSGQIYLEQEQRGYQMREHSSRDPLRGRGDGGVLVDGGVDESCGDAFLAIRSHRSWLIRLLKNYYEWRALGAHSCPIQDLLHSFLWTLIVSVYYHRRF
jgi:hypothetical protein